MTGNAENSMGAYAHMKVRYAITSYCPQILAPDLVRVQLSRCQRSQSTPERATEADMLSAGTRGYVTKNDAKELPQAIRAVMSDIEYLSPEVVAGDLDPVPRSLGAAPVI